MPFCKICEGYIWTPGSPHVCPPAFECRLDEKDKRDRDWCMVYAADAESAAEKFADRHDCENEYLILQQGDRGATVVEVRSSHGLVTLWKIRAESLAHYYADQITA